MNKIKEWIAGTIVKTSVSSLTELLKAIKDLLTDSKGKWSSKRTISGVLVVICATEIERTGVSTNALILSFIAVLPLCFSAFEKCSKKCSEQCLEKCNK